MQRGTPVSERPPRCVPGGEIALLGSGLLSQVSLFGLDVLLALLVVQLALLAELVGLGLLVLLLGELGISADLGVRVGVDLLQVVGGDALLLVARELLGVRSLVDVLEVAHVVSDVAAEDVLAEDSGVEGAFLALLALGVADEAGLGVRDVQATVARALQAAEDAGTGGGASQTDIEDAVERSGLALDGFDGVVLAVDLGLTEVLVVELDELEHTAGDEEAGGVRGGVVGQTKLDAVLGELVGVGGGEDAVAVELGVDDLADDVLVGEADDEAVLVGVVLGLVLADHGASGDVVGLALTAAAVLGLEALEVGFVLNDFHERHFLGNANLANKQEWVSSLEGSWNVIPRHSDVMCYSNFLFVAN